MSRGFHQSEPIPYSGIEFEATAQATCAQIR